MGTNISTLYKSALLFDGTGTPPVISDVLVANGRIAAMGMNLSAPDTVDVIDCAGKWLMPGLLDIHTHLDLEVELAPELPEVIRHGTTTVVMSNCSLGVAYGNQRRNGEDPIVDCFARVENVPKHVLRKVGDACTWTNSKAYLEHFSTLNLGPNVVPMIPHSMLRIEVMGLKDSVSREPSSAELDQMEALVEQGMQEGYVGLSTDGLPFHFLANKPNTRKQIPTQFASYQELKRLTGVLRRHDRVWQATPPKDSPYKTVRNFLLTSGRLFGSRLKVTATAAIDLHTNRFIGPMGLLLSRLLNSRLLKGHFRFQALAAPFRVWSDGVITPLAEEIAELRVLNELDLEDRLGRLQILNDSQWIKAFRKMWFKGKRGLTIANLLRLLRLESNVLNRRLDEMFIDICPFDAWNGQSLNEPYQRLKAWQSSKGSTGAMTAAENDFFSSFPCSIQDEADFFLHLLRSWDTGLRWNTTVANRNPEMLKKLLFHPLTLPGFNDSGAHLTNLAFYDGNLRTLKIAQMDGLEQVAIAVHRLTKAPAELFNINAGIIKIGAQADMCVLDPVSLNRWNPENTYQLIERKLFESKQVVNRPESVVIHVMVNGKVAWNSGNFTDHYGNEVFGRLMRAATHPSELSLAAAGVHSLQSPIRWAA